MTEKRAIQILKMNEQEKWRSGITAEEEKEAFDMAIEALGTIGGLCENLAWYINERNRLLQEQRPHGEWIKKPWGVVCARCKSQAPHSPNGNQLKSDFCPNCGSKMEVTDD